MRLWTDIVDPEQLTGFARAELSAYEAAKGTLARWLPNREVADVTVRFVAGQAGLVEEARYRAFDAEPEFGRGPQRKRITIDLVPLSQQGIISERDQLRLRNGSTEVKERILLDATRNAVRAVADRSERQRGTVLATGMATINQDNYKDSADYGRDASMGITASALWTTAGVDRLEAMSTWADAYATRNGVAPAAAVMSTRVARALASGSGLATQLVGGATRRATRDEVNAILESEGLPLPYIYDRRTSGGRVLPDDTILFLPEPVDTDGESELGATFWGQTLAASEPEWEIAESEQPGVVAAAFTHQGIPPIRHTYVDALSLPVLANADLAMAVKVL